MLLHNAVVVDTIRYVCLCDMNEAYSFMECYFVSLTEMVFTTPSSHKFSNYVHSFPLFTSDKSLFALRRLLSVINKNGKIQLRIVMFCLLIVLSLSHSHTNTKMHIIIVQPVCTHSYRDDSRYICVTVYVCKWGVFCV